MGVLAVYTASGQVQEIVSERIWRTDVKAVLSTFPFAVVGKMPFREV